MNVYRSPISSTLSMIFLTLLVFTLGCHGHDHSDHSDHNHSDHSNHDHSDHSDHDHSDHSDHQSGGAMEGSCDAPPAGQCFEIPWTVNGEIYELTIVKADPDTVIKGENEWTFSVDVLDSSDAADDVNPLITEGMCQLTVAPWMPDHGHGSSMSESEWTEENQYKVSGIDLIMPGFWEIKVNVQCDTTEEEIIFPLWLEN